jgi:fluoride exporter
MTAYLWIALGGALGSVARFWISNAVAQRTGEAFPWGTILVNVSGSFVIGVLASFASDWKWFATPAARQFLIVGVCGGYTTFSAFSLQTFDLMRAGEWLPAGLNAVVSVVLCLLAVWIGHALGLWLTRHE